MRCISWRTFASLCCSVSLLLSRTLLGLECIDLKMAAGSQPTCQGVPLNKAVTVNPGATRAYTWPRKSLFHLCPIWMQNKIPFTAMPRPLMSAESRRVCAGVLWPAYMKRWLETLAEPVSGSMGLTGSIESRPFPSTCGLPPKNHGLLSKRRRVRGGASTFGDKGHLWWVRIDFYGSEMTVAAAQMHPAASRLSHEQ